MATILGFVVGMPLGVEAGLPALGLDHVALQRDEVAVLRVGPALMRIRRDGSAAALMADDKVLCAGSFAPRTLRRYVWAAVGSVAGGPGEAAFRCDGTYVQPLTLQRYRVKVWRTAKDGWAYEVKALGYETMENRFGSSFLAYFYALTGCASPLGSTTRTCNPERGELR